MVAYSTDRVEVIDICVQALLLCLAKQECSTFTVGGQFPLSVNREIAAT